MPKARDRAAEAAMQAAPTRCVRAGRGGKSFLSHDARREYFFKTSVEAQALKLLKQEVDARAAGQWVPESAAPPASAACAPAAAPASVARAPAETWQPGQAASSGAAAAWEPAWQKGWWPAWNRTAAWAPADNAEATTGWAAASNAELGTSWDSDDNSTHEWAAPNAEARATAAWPPDDRVESDEAGAAPRQGWAISITWGPPPAGEESAAAAPASTAPAAPGLTPATAALAPAAQTATAALAPAEQTSANPEEDERWTWSESDGWRRTRPGN